MKIYFYHTVKPDYIHEQWRRGKFPGHVLYGATCLPEYGIDVIYHKSKANPNINRWKASIELIPAVFRHRKEISAVYGTSSRGMELLIFLRALRIFDKPIVIWHHQPVIINRNPIREAISRLFYKGIDHMFFFSEEIYQKSLQTHKVDILRMEICPWGCDLPYYEKLLIKGSGSQFNEEFISTGKECRDHATLMKAFGLCRNNYLHILMTHRFEEEAYRKEISKYLSPNIKIEINKSKQIPEIAEMILPYRCVCICCKETNYTVGLTTIIEAMAFGKPVIVTRNPNFPFDIDKEGISVRYNDVDGWVDAIRFISSHPQEAEEMGRRGRLLAERIYNVKNTAKIVADVIKRISNQAS